MPSYRNWTCVLALAVALSPSFVAAEVLQISAAGFFRHGPAADETVNGGVLVNGSGDYFAAVALPSGQRVCWFSLVYGDNTASNITAKLYRKTLTIGGPIDAPSTLMAQVTSAGASAKVRRVSTKVIQSNLIDTTAATYFAKLEIPTAALSAISVQMSVQSTC